MLTIDLVERAAYLDGKYLRLGMRPFEVLEALTIGTRTRRELADVLDVEITEISIGYHVHALRKAGVNIETRPNGYKLLDFEIRSDPRSPHCEGHLLCDGVVIYCARMTT